jgi:hypothetical protein
MEPNKCSTVESAAMGQSHRGDHAGATQGDLADAIPSGQGRFARHAMVCADGAARVVS